MDLGAIVTAYLEHIIIFIGFLARLIVVISTFKL